MIDLIVDPFIHTCFIFLIINSFFFFYIIIIISLLVISSSGETTVVFLVTYTGLLQSLSLLKPRPRKLTFICLNSFKFKYILMELLGNQNHYGFSHQMNIFIVLITNGGSTRFLSCTQRRYWERF